MGKSFNCGEFGSYQSSVFFMHGVNECKKYLKSKRALEKEQREDVPLCIEIVGGRGNSIGSIPERGKCWE